MRTCENCGATLDHNEVCDCTARDSEQNLIRIVQLPLIEEQLHVIRDEIQTQVNNALRLACTDETLSTVKEARANINKTLAEYEERRKAVKKAIIGPYDAFEAVYKECVSDICKKADAELKSKIVSVEDGLKSQCEDTLRGYFAELVQSYGIGWLRYEQLNVKVDMVSARQASPKRLMQQIYAQVNQIKADLQTISAMDSASEILAEYKNCLFLGNAIQSVHERHRAIEESAEQERRRQEIEQMHRQSAVQPKEDSDCAFTVPERISKAAPEDPTLTVSFTVTDKKSRLKLLKAWMQANNYDFK